MPVTTMEPITAPPLSQLFFFDPERASVRERRVKQAVRKKPKTLPKFICAVCRQGITDEAQRITVQGSHTHVFTNPAGVTYDIACFGDAAGCASTGDATTAFTWFSGYAWRIALCVGCQTHLGWCFETPPDRFFGLIRDRLILLPADAGE